MKFDKFPKRPRKAITKIRLNNSERYLKKEQNKFPLLSQWIADQQPTALERVEKFEDSISVYWKRLRDNNARDWRLARKLIYGSPQKKQILERWNNCRYPKSPCYLLAMLRKEFNLIP